MRNKVLSVIFLVILVDGWIQVKSGLRYYMLEDGSVLTDAYTPDGYYVDENGVWVQ